MFATLYAWTVRVRSADIKGISHASVLAGLLGARRRVNSRLQSPWYIRRKRNYPLFFYRTWSSGHQRMIYRVWNGTGIVHHVFSSGCLHSSLYVPPLLELCTGTFSSLFFCIMLSPSLGHVWRASIILAFYYSYTWYFTLMPFTIFVLE